MGRPSLADLADFAAVAAHRSFRRAARERGVSPSALSHSVRDLEERLGVRLLNRTTRSVAVSAAGQRLLSRLRPALADIDTALEELNSFRNEPTGVLKLNVPRAAAPVVIAPLLARFAERYPAIRVEIAADDALVDVVGAGFDAGVRFSERVPRDMVAVRIGPDLRFAVIASPGYFEGRKKPRTPQDLRQHQCIRYRFPSGAHYRWEFEKNGQAIAVDVDGPLGLDDQELMTYAALGGAGLAFVFEQRAQPYLDSRQLVRVLEDWCPAFPGMFLYYPGRRQMPVPLRLFVDMLKEARR